MSTTKVLTREGSYAATQASIEVSSMPEQAPAAVEQADRRSIKLSTRLVETVRNYCDLGLTSFGGPGVHVIILRKRFVDRLRWLDETTFSDLFSLGNALPGPGSTQLAFSIATVRNGTLAGLIAFLFWSVPGAAGMAALGAGVRKFPDRLPPIVLALLTGLNASAVGLIALAAFQLSKTAITDPITRILVLVSASIGICYHAPWMYPVLVFVGGAVTLVYDFHRPVLNKLRPRQRGSRNASSQSSTPARNGSNQDMELVSRRPEMLRETPSMPGATPLPERAEQSGLRQRSGPMLRSIRSSTVSTQAMPETTRTPIMVLNKKFALGLGVLFIGFVVTLVVVRSQLASVPRLLDFFTNMVIAGVIIFGGGPVVIPLLRGYTVENGWVDSRDFLLGFAILQAFPGPNFNFAAYLGVLAIPANPCLGAVVGWTGIFAPGIVLKLSLLPVYDSWRKHQVAKSILRGLNAAAVGLVYTAVWQLFLVGYIYTSASGTLAEATSHSGPLTSDPFWGVVASTAFVASQWFQLPPAFAVVGGALAGMAWYGVVGPRGTERQQLLP